jgi:MFS family permease
MSVYRALLARPHARMLALACALGWLSFASLSLGVVLVVHRSTGSFGVAGAAVAAFGAGVGLLSPVRGQLVDRRGARALLVFGTTYTIALTALLALATLRAPAAALVAAAGATGAVAPPLIASARAVWPHVAGAELARAGHALNALIGDAGAVLGPLILGGIAALGSPATAMAAVGAGPVLGCVLVARIGIPVVPAPAGRSGALRASGGLRTIAAAGVPLGAALGALNVAAPAVADRQGAPELAAVPFACFAAASVLASLWAGHSRRAGPPAQRYVAGFSGFAAVLLGCLVVDSLVGLSLVLAAAGLAFGLLNVGLLELLDEIVPEHNAVESLAWVTSSEAVGAAAGAAAAGALAESTSAALAVAALAPLAGAAITLARRGTVAERVRSTIA